MGFAALLNPVSGPAEQNFGRFLKINRGPAFQTRESIDNDSFARRSDGKQILLVLHIVSRLLKNNCLYNKDCRLIQSAQNVRAFCVEHIVDTAMKDVAGADMNRSVHSVRINELKHFIQASP